MIIFIVFVLNLYLIFLTEILNLLFTHFLQIIIIINYQCLILKTKFFEINYIILSSEIYYYLVRANKNGSFLLEKLKYIERVDYCKKFKSVCIY